jgi:hypothetical protein
MHGGFPWTMRSIVLPGWLRPESNRAHRPIQVAHATVVNTARLFLFLSKAIFDRTQGW